MIRIAAAFAVAILAFVAPAAAKAKPAPTLAPIDQSAQDPQLAALIAELLAACERKDPEPFRRALSPNAVASFGGDEGGVESFVATHGLEDPASPFWTEFPEALRLGGVFMDKTTFGAPYAYAAFPDEFDPFEFVVAIGPKTLLRDRPDATATVARDVTHQLLKVEFGADATAPDDWLEAAAVDEKGNVLAKGFVRTSEVRSPLDYRAVFQKTENRWWLGAFVAGD